MTTDELRSAAEMVVATGMHKDWADTIDAGAVAVCRAWLAKYPADDGADADRAWMLSVGFMGCADHPHLLDIPIDEHTGWHLFLRVHLALREAQIMQAPVGGEAFGVALSKSPVKTRGDVRRLASALGITLTEPRS